MNNDVIRIGKVSSVNAADGMVRVTYPDKDNSVTAELPVFSFTGEYRMPEVGSQVLVVHLSNGTAAGIVLGNYWNKSAPPPVNSGFYKDLGGNAYMECSGGTLTIHADSIVLDGTTTIDGATSISGTTTIDGIDFSTHTHTGAHGETSGPH